MLPDFDEHGNLPPGIYRVSINEIIERFGRPLYTVRRERAAHLKEFHDFISKVAIGLYVDGSFITSKLAPSDVDLLVLLPDNFTFNSGTGLRLKSFQKAKSKNRLDIFPMKQNEDHQRIENWIDNWRHDRNGNWRGIIYLEFGGSDDQK